MAASAPTAAPHARLEKPPAYRWWILVANMLAYGQFFLTVQVVNAFSSTVQAEWHLAAADLALLTTVTLAGYALASGIGGKLEKRFGARRTVVGGIAANVVLGLLFPAAGSAYAGMIVLRFLQGVAGGCIASSVVSSTVLWFPVRQRGLAQGCCGSPCANAGLRKDCSWACSASGSPWRPCARRSCLMQG